MIAVLHLFFVDDHISLSQIDKKTQLWNQECDYIGKDSKKSQSRYYIWLRFEMIYCIAYMVQGNLNNDSCSCHDKA